jgi:hypothetical protein
MTALPRESGHVIALNNARYATKAGIVRASFRLRWCSSGSAFSFVAPGTSSNAASDTLYVKRSSTGWLRTAWTCWSSTVVISFMSFMALIPVLMGHLSANHACVLGPRSPFACDHSHKICVWYRATGGWNSDKGSAWRPLCPKSGMERPKGWGS